MPPLTTRLLGWLGVRAAPRDGDVQPLVFPLRTERLALRPFTDADVPAMRGIYGDPEVMRWVGHGPVSDDATIHGMLAQYLAHQRAHGFAFWAVTEAGSGRVIGDAGVALTAGGEAEMGYTLERSAWGRGLGTEVAGLCADLALSTLGFSRVRALVEPENERSLHVLEKLGFTQEGTTLAFGRSHLVLRKYRDRDAAARTTA